MIPYIILYLLVLISIFWKKTNITLMMKTKSFKVPIDFVFFSIIFTFFYATREFVGYDYQMYYDVINNNLYEGYMYRNEWLSYYFMDISYYFDEPRIFFALIAIIAIPIYFYVFKKYSKNRINMGWMILAFLALPIGFIQTLSVSRQFIATAIVLLATKYIITRNLKKYIFCLLLATLFHFSSVISILFYIINCKKFKYKYFIFIFIIMGFFLEVIKILINNYFELYSGYFNYTFLYQGGLMQLFMYIILGLVFVYIRFYKKYIDNYYEVCLKNYLLGLMITIMFFGFQGLLGIRLGFVGLTYAIILFAYTLNTISKKNILFYKFACIIIFSICFFYNLYVATEAYIPYKNFIFD